MKIKFVFYLFPVFVFFTDRLLSDDIQGKSKLMFIFIRPDKRHNEGLLAHEMEHAKQYYIHVLIGFAGILIFFLFGAFIPDALLIMPFTLFPMHYTFSRWYRYKAEIDAYAAQLRLQPASEKELKRKAYAAFITEVPPDRYRLKGSKTLTRADMDLYYAL